MNKITLLVLSALSLFGVAVSEASAQAVPLYRYENSASKEVLLSATPWELSNQWVRKETLGFVYTQQYANVVPFYRYVNASVGDHFYTTDYNELKGGAYGWEARGIGSYVFDSQVPGTIALYRYATAGGKHHFTTNKAEGDSKAGYKLERIAAYIYPPSGQAPTNPPTGIPSGPVVIGTTTGQPVTPGSNPSGPVVVPSGPTVVTPSGPTTNPNPGNGPSIGGTSRETLR
ncbi:MAG: hypothetical protein ABW252_14240 [Polyangiales bacterium]